MTTYRVHVLHVPGADPERDEIVETLRQTFDACVHEDPKRKGCMYNWLATMRCASMNDSEDWSLTLSDDALPYASTVDHLERALANSPEAALGLTHFGGYGEGALKKGKAYGVGAMVVWGGAIALRRDIVNPLTKAAMTYHMATGYPHDDGMISLFQAARGDATAMTSRALFDQPIKESLLGHNTPIRRPNTNIVDDEGPDWDASSVARISRGSLKDFNVRLDSFRAVVAPNTSQGA